MSMRSNSGMRSNGDRESVRYRVEECHHNQNIALPVLVNKGVSPSLPLDGKGVYISFDCSIFSGQIIARINFIDQGMSCDET